MNRILFLLGQILLAVVFGVVLFKLNNPKKTETVTPTQVDSREPQTTRPLSEFDIRGNNWWLSWRRVLGPRIKMMVVVFGVILLALAWAAPENILSFLKEWGPPAVVLASAGGVVAYGRQQEEVQQGYEPTWWGIFGGIVLIVIAIGMAIHNLWR